MGITNFTKCKIHNSKSPYDGQTVQDVFVKKTMKELSETRIGIDASYQIYNSILAMEHVTALSDKEGNTTIHINTIFNKVCKFKENDIEMIWLFDSPESHELKQKYALKSRAEKRDTATKAEISDHDKGKRTFRMTSQHVNDIKELLFLMGVICIEAPKGLEAEQLGAFLTKEPNPIIKYVLSGDMDVLVFGGNLLRIYKTSTATGLSKKETMDTLLYNDLIDATGLTHTQLATAAVALGCDFADKVDRIGPAKALDPSKLKMELNEDQKAAVSIFTEDITTKAKASTLIKGQYNKEKLIEFLIKRNFDKERITKRITEIYEPKSSD